MHEEKARQQIAVLPYYHSLENEITESKRGIFVTHYFLTKWAPDLGHPCTAIVLALQKLADKKTGETFASLDEISRVAGVSRSTVSLWLSRNPEPWKSRSPVQRRQWELLQRYWIISKTKRYRQFLDDSGHSHTRVTTSIIRVTVDDPVHPSDLPRLYALAAERLVQEEIRERQGSNEGTADPYESSSWTHKDSKRILRSSGVDNSPYESSSQTHNAVRQLDSRSSLYRFSSAKEASKNETGSSTFAEDPRVLCLTGTQRSQKERLTYELQTFVNEKSRDHNETSHAYTGLFRRAAYFMPETLLRQAMREFSDFVTQARAGEKPPIRNYSKVLWGFLKRRAAQDGVDLVPQSGQPSRQGVPSASRQDAGPQRGPSATR